MNRFLILVLAMLVSGVSTAEAQSARIALDPPNLQGQVGSIVQLTVLARNLENVSAVDVTVSFNPSVLMFVYSQPGTMWAGQTMLTISDGTPAGMPGYYSLIAADQYGVYGDYSIIVLYFYVLAEGESHFTMGSDDLTAVAPIYVSQSGFLQYDFAIDNEADFSTPNPPPALTDLIQSDEPSGSPKSEGFIDEDGKVYVSATLPSVEGEVLFEVEVKPNAVAFDGLGTVSGGAGESELMIDHLPNGNYHWRIRARFAGGAASSWVEFGVSAGPDFTIAIPLPPPPPVPVTLPSSGKKSSGCGGSVPGDSGALLGCFVALLVAATIRKGGRVPA